MTWSIKGHGFKGNHIICRGRQNSIESDRCYSIENNEWVSSDSMCSKRVAAAATQLQNGKLFVTGGYNGLVDVNSAEILTEEG